MSYFDVYVNNSSYLYGNMSSARAITASDTNNMNIIHNCIDYSLIEPVSKMMMTIEQIDVYNIHNLIF